jgi:hypothetical protein
MTVASSAQASTENTHTQKNMFLVEVFFYLNQQ